MLTGKIALITGGGRGTGRAVALLFAKKGADVIICARGADELNETSELVLKSGGKCEPVVCDVGNEEEVKGMFGKIEEKHGRLDILVNNAGIFASGPMQSATLEKFEHVFNVNCTGAFLCCREAFGLMKEKGGSIVNVSSLSGVQGVEKFPGFGTYVVSKFGMTGLTEALAVEWKDHRIRVNAVCPGAVDTEMLQKAAPHLKQRLTPEQVASAIIYFAGPESSGITGTIMPIFSHLLP